jgi:hypothetical protein
MRYWVQRRWWAVLAALVLLGGLVALLATRQRLPLADISLTYGVGYDHVQYEAGEACVCCHSQQAYENQTGYEHPPSPLQAIPPGAAPTASTWELVGPAPMRNSYMGAVQINVSGRVTALAVDPSDASGDTVYLAAAQGGVWKTTDGGGSWTPLTDDQASLSMGALALAPSNSNIIYAGTGEPNSGLDNYYGAGILKSTDGGATWSRLGANEFTGAGISSIGYPHPSFANSG